MEKFQTTANMKKKWTIPCEICGTDIHTNRANRAYCSKECVRKGRHVPKTQCDICGKKFKIGKKPWYEYTGYKSKKYCSDECWKTLCKEATKDTRGLKNGKNYGTHF